MSTVKLEESLTAPTVKTLTSSSIASIGDATENSEKYATKCHSGKNCPRIGTCKFAHHCDYYLSAEGCNKSDEVCRYLHIDNPTDAKTRHHVPSKSIPCRNFASESGCPFGIGCHFAHGKTSSTVADVNTDYVTAQWHNFSHGAATNDVTHTVTHTVTDTDVTHTMPDPRRRTKICNHFLKGTCKFGDRCHNEHPTDVKIAEDDMANDDVDSVTEALADVAIADAVAVAVDDATSTDGFVTQESSRSRKKTRTLTNDSKDRRSISNSRKRSNSKGRSVSRSKSKSRVTRGRSFAAVAQATQFQAPPGYMLVKIAPNMIATVTDTATTPTPIKAGLKRSAPDDFVNPGYDITAPLVFNMNDESNSDEDVIVNDVRYKTPSPTRPSEMPNAPVKAVHTSVHHPAAPIPFGIDGQGHRIVPLRTRAFVTMPELTKALNEFGIDATKFLASQGLLFNGDPSAETSPQLDAYRSPQLDAHRSPQSMQTPPRTPPRIIDRQFSDVFAKTFPQVLPKTYAQAIPQVTTSVTTSVSQSDISRAVSQSDISRAVPRTVPSDATTSKFEIPKVSSRITERGAVDLKYTTPPRPPTHMMSTLVPDTSSDPHKSSGFYGVPGLQRLRSSKEFLDMIERSGTGSGISHQHATPQRVRAPFQESLASPFRSTTQAQAQDSTTYAGLLPKTGTLSDPKASTSTSHNPVGDEVDQLMADLHAQNRKSIEINQQLTRLINDPTSHASVYHQRIFTKQRDELMAELKRIDDYLASTRRRLAQLLHVEQAELI